jgi:hypothetical protein
VAATKVEEGIQIGNRINKGEPLISLVPLDSFLELKLLNLINTVFVLLLESPDGKVEMM